MERNSTQQTDQPKQAQKPRQKQAQQPKPAQAQTQKPKQAQEASKPKQKQASKPKQTEKPTKATKSAQKRKSGQTSQPVPKQKAASKPNTAQKRKSGQTDPTLSAYEARRKAEEARKQADLARIIQKLQNIQNTPSEPVPYPEDTAAGKGSFSRHVFAPRPSENKFSTARLAESKRSTALSAPKIAKGCLTVIILGVLLTYALGRYVHRQDERKRAAMEIPADKDANHQGTDIAYPRGNQAGAPEAPGRPTNAPSAAAPADTITVSYQDYLLYRAMKNRYSGVELDLGHGVSIQTGLDESEIMDQIAADGDIYSLTDYFDEYVGD